MLYALVDDCATCNVADNWANASWNPTTHILSYSLLAITVGLVNWTWNVVLCNHLYSHHCRSGELSRCAVCPCVPCVQVCHVCRVSMCAVCVVYPCVLCVQVCCVSMCVVCLCVSRCACAVCPVVLCAMCPGVPCVQVCLCCVLLIVNLSSPNYYYCFRYLCCCMTYIIEC